MSLRNGERVNSIVRSDVHQWRRSSQALCVRSPLRRRAYQVRRCESFTAHLAADLVVADADRAQLVCFRTLACMGFHSRTARSTIHDSFNLLRNVTTAPSASTRLRGSARAPPLHAVISCLLERSASGECKGEAVKLLNILLASLVQVNCLSMKPTDMCI